MRLQKILSSSLVLGALLLNGSSGFAVKLNTIPGCSGFSDSWTGDLAPRGSSATKIFVVDHEGFPMAPDKVRLNYFPPRDSSVQLDTLAISIAVGKPVTEFVEFGKSWITGGTSANIMVTEGKRPNLTTEDPIVVEWGRSSDKPQMVGPPYNSRSLAALVEVPSNRQMSRKQINAVKDYLAYHSIPLVYASDHHELRSSTVEEGQVANMGL